MLPDDCCYQITTGVYYQTATRAYYEIDTRPWTLYTPLQELQRRCDTLIRLVEKENEEIEAQERDDRKKTTKKTASRFDTLPFICLSPFQ